MGDYLPFPVAGQEHVHMVINRLCLNGGRFCIPQALNVLKSFFGRMLSGMAGGGKPGLEFWAV